MPKGKIVTGLDIGTSSIKILVAQKAGKELEVLAQTQIPSFGVRRGAVAKVEEVSKNIEALIAEAEKLSGRKIKSVFVNIGGSHLRITPSDGLISVSRADQKISQEDIERVLQAARAINIPSNEEVLDVFPREFIIDDQKGIKEPLGLTGIRLEVKANLLCVFSPFFINLTQAVLGSNLQIDDIVPSPLAAAAAVLTPQQKELGSAVVDIGHSTTGLAVFEEGELIHFAVFPIGSGHITNDIALGLQVSLEEAEQLKFHYVSDNQKRKLGDIIDARLGDIFELIQNHLKKIGRNELLPAGAVIIGGGANLPNLEDFAKSSLKL
ncbi:cell division protein FtsA, partial [Patescibacteria group bacterium]|nr:cell division protein FtsA [Patescibacteria group bacterium]